MAMNRQFPVDDRVIAELCAMGNLSRSEAVALVQQKGLDALRVKVAAVLYTQTSMTSGDAATRVGLRNRGLLLRYLDDHRIPPASADDDDSEMAQREFSRRRDERLSRLRS